MNICLLGLRLFVVISCHTRFKRIQSITLYGFVNLKKIYIYIYYSKTRNAVSVSAHCIQCCQFYKM